MTVSDRRFALRTRTAAAHAALDAHVGALDGPEAYARYLRGIHAFRAPVERALAGVPDAPAPLAGLIEADMAAAGVAPAAARRFDTPADASALAGVAYVLEGSSLGARLLHRQVTAFGADCRHLAAQTADAGAWSAFCTRLDRTEPYDADTAARAALATFAFALLAFGAGDG